MADKGRREDIIQSARALFSEKGYHGTTIRDIAQMSGILSGSLYAHIRTKEDLLYEIVDGVADQFLEALEGVVAKHLAPEDKFRQALAAHISVVAKNLDAATVFSHEWRALEGERRTLIQEKRDMYERLWQEVIEYGVAEGTFVFSNQRFSRIVSLSVANWLYQWYDPAGELSAGAVADRLADVLLYGIDRRSSNVGTNLR